MKVLVNKTFNTEILAEYLNNIMQPKEKMFEVGQFKVYSDITSGTSTQNGNYAYTLFAPQSYLDIIDVLNQKSYDGTLDLGDDVELDVLINSLYSADRTIRNNAITFIEGKGYITAEQSTAAKTLTSTLNSYNPLNLVKEYSEIEDVYKYSFNTPIELETPYDVTNNTNNDKMYLVFLSLCDVTFGNVKDVLGAGGKYSSLQQFYNPERDINVEQASYIATEMGDINSDDADIKYDHMDKIEYIDSFRLRFKLPRVIN